MLAWLSAVIGEALEREAGLLRVKARVLRGRIKRFEEKYGMGSEEFREKFESGELGDEEDFFIWWSLLEALSQTKNRLNIVKMILHNTYQ